MLERPDHLSLQGEHTTPPFWLQIQVSGLEIMMWSNFGSLFHSFSLSFFTPLYLVYGPRCVFWLYFFFTVRVHNVDFNFTFLFIIVGT